MRVRNQMSKTDWDARWLGLAEHVAGWSKDPSTKVGAILARDKEFISLGYNGFPTWIKDRPELLNNREEKYKRVIHAEVNVFKTIPAGKVVTGSTLYVWPFQPCSRCTLQIINHGVKRIVTVDAPEDKKERWKYDFEQSEILLDEADVELIFKK